MADLRDLAKQAQRLQAQLAEAQRRLGEAEVEGSAGGGVVTAVVNGHGELRRIRISPEVVQGGDAELLGDLVLAAVQEAQRQAKALAEKTLAPFLPPGVSP
ncbi:MAG: YbaB/EbfC family nucleoid-associated protein [Candidatus Bipolaricaulota bacterium]|nr:YbaB/EbfC family nucleoid-associated protein [Candidatus Bipolaricaulota bacterium]